MAAFHATLLHESRPHIPPSSTVASSSIQARPVTTRDGFLRLWKPAVRNRLAYALASLRSADASPGLLVAGKRKARSTAHDDAVARLRAAADLSSALFLDEVARAVAASPARVVAALDDTADALLHTFTVWTAGYVNDAVHSLRRLRRSLRGSKEVDGIALSKFLDDVSHQAAKKAAGKNKAALSPEVAGFARFGAGGTTAAHKVLAGLKFLAKNAGVLLPVESPLLKRFKITMPVPFVANHLRDSLLEEDGYILRLKASVECRAARQRSSCECSAQTCRQGK